MYESSVFLGSLLRGGTPLYLHLLHPPAVHSLTSGYGLSCGC